MGTIAAEIGQGRRFRFGNNWKRFLVTVDSDRISIARQSLLDYLGLEALNGKTFLDIGSGSGLFSLAARDLGASVYSFDYDPESVACAEELRARYYPGDRKWTVAEGSILDPNLVGRLGQFDVVYSWGVLHHTGDMWRAIGNAADLVKPGGILFIGIYDDRGRVSRFWRVIKKTYCSGPAGQYAVSGLFLPIFFARTGLSMLRRGENLFASYRRNRGMSMVHDWIDWLGGYPFEVARADQIFHFCWRRGFTLRALRTPGGSSGVNQFVFVKMPPVRRVVKKAQ